MKVLFSVLLLILISGCEPDRSGEQTIPLTPNAQNPSAAAPIPVVNNPSPPPATRTNQSPRKTQTPPQVPDVNPVVTPSGPAAALMGKTPGEVRSFGQPPIPFRWCPAGTYYLKSDPVTEDTQRRPKRSKQEEAELEPYLVTITNGYWIAETEITKAQWTAVMESTPWEDKFGWSPDLTVPAFAVSWYDAQSFCRKLTTQIQSGRNLPGDLEVRLPTEAQWEYACRAEQPTRFSFGSDPGEVLAKTFAQYKASFEKTPRRFPAPVGKKEPNPWGLRDMHGNVAEWCLDVFSSQPRAGVDPDQSGGASMKVIRGGHITSTHEEILSTSREERNTDDTSEFIGFRPVIVFENFKPEPIASPGTTPIPGAPPGGPYRGTKPGEARRFTSLDLEFRWCPAGTASLGSTPTEPGRGPTENPVTVTFQNGFWISATEITQAQWLTQFSERPWEQYQIANNSQFPAMYLDGRKVQQFCQELTTKERNRKELTSEFEIRLPTESEWEYACRAGTRTAFFYGDDPQYLTLSKYAVYRIIPSRDYEPAVVRSKEPNAWGLYDMLGNAAEWCESVHTMRMLGGTDPTGPQFGGMQVVRGGSYKDQGAMLRSSARKGVAPQEVTEPIGFRIVIATVRN